VIKLKKIKILLLLLLLTIPFKVKAIDTSAESAILMDQDSGRILYAKNIHKRKLIASTTKIMTAILAIESNKLDMMVTVDEEIFKAIGSSIYVEVGEEIKLHDLVYGLMLRSGNDAALVIAKNVSGSVSNFIDEMNKKALEIGMTNTTFMNPHGLDNENENYSTAYDMALLASYAMKNEIYKEIVSTKEYTVKTNYKTYIWHNKNKLLTMYEYATGGKTGYTEKAHRTLVTTASKNNLNLVVVTLNDGNDFDDHKSLYEYGFEKYKSYSILENGELEVYDDTYYEDYTLYINNSFNYPLESVEVDTLMTNIRLEKLRKFNDNDKVGEIEVKMNDKVIHKEDIFVKTKIKEKVGFWNKIANWFKRLW